MSENKKIVNATKTQINNIKFKSKLESVVYRELVKSNLPFTYEEEQITLFKGYYPTIPFYIKGKNGHLVLQTRKQLDWKYTPDFIVNTSGWKFYIEAKGYQNDLWPYKRKLFIHTLLESTNVAFFEVHNLREIKECISIIKNEYETKITEHYEEPV